VIFRPHLKHAARSIACRDFGTEAVSRDAERFGRTRSVLQVHENVVVSGHIGFGELTM
jgi:hypothetical protein